jgi:nitrogen regulatory protein PII-like uncharacterized protein
MNFNALVIIVPEEQEDKAINIAKKAGAGGVTILNGKGMGLKEKKVFFNLTYEAHESVLLFVLPKKVSEVILNTLNEELGLKNNHGIGFSIPINQVVGMDKEQEKVLEQEEESI